MSTTLSEYSESEISDADEEWAENLRQLELLSSLVILPFVGKYLGRRVAYYAFNRWMEWRSPVVHSASFGAAGGLGT